MASQLMLSEGNETVAMKHEQPNHIENRHAPNFVREGGEEPTGRTIQSVDRALQVLEAIAAPPDGMTVSAVSETVGLNASTCHHLITTLVHRGYLTQVSRSRGYALGRRLSELLEMSEKESDPAVLLEPGLRSLGARLGHGVQFAVLSDTSLLTKLSIPSDDDAVAEPSEVEKMKALHATATGKAIVAWIPDTELVRVISANGLTSYTPRTITTLSGLVDGSLKLTYIHGNLEIFGGYRALLLSGMALASDQFDFSINEDPGAVLNNVNHQGSTILHGPFMGLIYTLL